MAREFACHLCKDQHQLEIALQKYQPNQQQPPTFSYLFNSAAQFEAHFKKQHANHRHECEVCHNRFSSELVLGMHRKCVHQRD